MFSGVVVTDLKWEVSGRPLFSGRKCFLGGVVLFFDGVV